MDQIRIVKIVNDNRSNGKQNEVYTKMTIDLLLIKTALDYYKYTFQFKINGIGNIKVAVTSQIYET